MTRVDNWHIDVPVDTSDPFADTPVDVREEGLRIDLTDPATLNAKLTALLLVEGRLHDRGISCALKSRPDTCCSACPLFGTLQTHGIRKLCRVGRAQEDTVMRMLAPDA